MRWIAASLTLGLLLANAAPLAAQPPLVPGGDVEAAVREARAIDRLFSQAESARLNGNCAQRDGLLNQAGLKAADGGTAGYFGPDALAAYARRITEARARPCPPTGGTAPPPPPTETATPPTGDPPPPPDGSIMDAMADPPAPVTSTTAPVPGPTPLSPEARDVMNRVEGAFTDAENARTAGHCAIRDEALNRILAAIGAWAGSGVIDAGLIENWRARLAAARALPCPPPGAPADRRVGFLFGGGYGESTLPRANYGFLSDGTAGSERPAGYSRLRIPALTVEGAAEFRGIGRFALRYRQGDARNGKLVAPDASLLQGVVGTDNALSGSTGVAARLGVGVDTVASLDEFFGSARFNLYGFGNDRAWARAEARSSVYSANDVTMAPTRVPRRETRLSGRVTAELFALHRDSDYLGTVSIAGTTGAGTPVSVVQDLDQEVRQVEAGLNIGVEATISLSGSVWLAVGGQVGGYYFDYDGRSTENRVQNVGPTVDRAYTLTLDDDRNGIGYSGTARAELGFDLVRGGQPGGRALELFVAGEAGYFSHRAQVRNPFSGDTVLNGGTTNLGTDDAFDWSMSIGMRLRLATASGVFVR